MNQFFDLQNPSRKSTVKVLAAGNYLALVLETVQGIFFVPLYLSHFSERLYGLWLASGGMIAILSFLDMGIATLAIQRISAEYGKKDYAKVGLYFSNGMLVQSLLMIVLLALGALLSFFLDRILTVTEPEMLILSKATLLAVVALVLSIINNAVEGSLNALQKPLVGKVTQNLSSLVCIGTTFLMLKNGWSVLAIPAGLVVRALCALVPNLAYILAIFRKNSISSLSFSRAVVKDYVCLGGSIFFSKLGVAMVGNIEPTLITMFISPQVTVYYSVTSKAGALLKTVFDRIAGTIYPSLAHLYSCNEHSKFRNVIFSLVKSFFPIALSCFLLYFVANEAFVDIWVGKENYLGDSITLLISVALLLSFVSNMMSYLISITGDLKYPARMVLVESLVKISFLYLFLRFFGVVGLPVAITATSLLFIVLFCARWNMHLMLPKTEVVRELKAMAVSSLPVLALTFGAYVLKVSFDMSVVNVAVPFIAVMSLSLLILNYGHAKSLVSLIR